MASGGLLTTKEATDGGVFMGASKDYSVRGGTATVDAAVTTSIAGWLTTSVGVLCDHWNRLIWG